MGAIGRSEWLPVVRSRSGPVNVLRFSLIDLMPKRSVPNCSFSDRRRFVFERLEPRRLLTGTTLFFTQDITGSHDQLLSVEGLVRGSGTVDLASQPGYLAVETGDSGLNVGVIDAKNIAGQNVVVVGGDLVSAYDGDDIHTQIGSTWDPDAAQTVATVADSIVVITGGGGVRRLDSGLVVGASHDLAGTSLTRLAVGDTQIAIGDSLGVGRILDVGLNVVGSVDVNGSNNFPITAVAVGSVGDVSAAAYFAHSILDGAGNIISGTGLLYDSSEPGTISSPGRLLGTNGAQHGVVPAVIVDAVIGDSDAERVGNEIVVASFNPVVNHAPGGVLGEISATAGALVDLGKYHSVNNHIAGIAVGPYGNATKDSVIEFGASPWNGDTRPAVDHWQAFDDGPGVESPPQNLNYLLWHSGANRAEIRDGVIGEISSNGDATSTEFVQVGPLYGTPLSGNGSDTTLGSSSIIEIQNTNSGSGNLQEITVAGEILTSVALADILGEDGLKEIVVGAESGNVLVYSHTNLSSPFVLAGSLDLGGEVLELATLAGGVPIAAPAAGVDALAMGDFGSRTDQIVIARETSADSNDVLILSTGALDPGVDVAVAGGPTAGGTAHGLALGPFQSGSMGNELLVGLTDQAVVGGNGHHVFYTLSGNSGQYSLERPISDVAAGDLNGNGAVDFVLTGLNSGSESGFGQGSLVFEASGGSGVVLDSPSLVGTHHPPSFLAVAIGNLDADSDQELALVGDDFVRVLDNNGAGQFAAVPMLQSNSLENGARFVDVVIADADGDAANEVIAITDFGTVYMFGHETVGDAASPFSSAPIGVYSAGGGPLLGVAALAQQPEPGVLGRHIFYNNSSFDGNNPLANSSDDLAIATDKTALLPAQQATFANYTSFSKGINGIFVDVLGLANPLNLGPADFQFRVGSGSDSTSWGAAPQPVNDIADGIRLGAGVEGSDRVTLIWSDQAITGQWLEVTIKATANTGLLQDDVFYVGNAIGETGNSGGDALVTLSDLEGALNHSRGPFDRASITDIYDFNRDRLVGAQDGILARSNLSSAVGELELLAAPLTAGAAFRITETEDVWLQLEDPLGKTWSFEHFSDSGMEIDSALKIGVDGSPLDVYLAEHPGGMRLYLWEDGRVVPDMPHTHIKPTLAVWGDMLVGDISSLEDNPMTLFMREQEDLSASATTSFFSAANGISDVDGGASMVFHPDHHRDVDTWPGDPVDHPLSGSLEVIAYGQGPGEQANAILFKTRSGPGTVADRMMIKDGTVSVDGNVVATGSVMSGSSRSTKDHIEVLSGSEAIDLVTDLEAIHFNYLTDSDQPRLGFVAEEVPEVFSAADRKGVDPMGIAAALSRLVQTNGARIEQLSIQVETAALLPGTESGNSEARLATDTGSVVSVTGTDSTTFAATLPPSVAPGGEEFWDVADGQGMVVATSSSLDLTEVFPQAIPETGGQWFQMETAEGERWYFDHAELPHVNIDSAFRISMDSSPLDFYLEDETDGLNMYLWEDGRPVPNMPHTQKKPTVAVWGDMYASNIATIGRDARQMFLRDETGLSASSGTVLFSANKGINNTIDGGAGMVIRPDHNRDQELYPGESTEHYQSGALQLIAFGDGSGSRANAVIFQTRDGPDSVSDRMVVSNNTTIYGNLVATGSITPGSSRELKQSIEPLSTQEAESLVTDLEAVSFTYTADPGQQRLGFIAEEVPAVFGNVQRNGVDAMGVVAALTQVVQTQQLEINNLQTEVADSAGAEHPVVAVSSTVEESVDSPTALASDHVASDSQDVLAGQTEAAVEQAGMVVATSSNVTLPEVPPFRIVDSGGRWLELEETGGKTWSMEHFSDASLGIDSALHIHTEDSARDLYLADEPDGMRMYLWGDDTPVPDLPQTGAKPHLAIDGDMFLGDIITNGRGALSMFNRVEQQLSASATTTLYSAREGITSDVDGGAGVVLYPDHHQDLESWPGDPADHPLSGSLELVAYGQGSGSQANAILIQNRYGNALADRMVIKDGTVTVYGGIFATGSVTPGSSRATKENIEGLTASEALELVASLEPVSFTYTADPGQRRLGFVAEDVAEVFGTSGRKAVDPMGIIAALSRVVQTQHEQLNEIFAEMASSTVVQNSYTSSLQDATQTKTALAQKLDRPWWPTSVIASSTWGIGTPEVKRANKVDLPDIREAALEGDLGDRGLRLLGGLPSGHDRPAWQAVSQRFHPDNKEAVQERRLNEDELASVWSAGDDWLQALNRRAFR